MSIRMLKRWRAKSESLESSQKKNKGEKLETDQLKVKYAELKGTFTAGKELQKIQGTRLCIMRQM